MFESLFCFFFKAKQGENLTLRTFVSKWTFLPRVNQAHCYINSYIPIEHTTFILQCTDSRASRTQLLASISCSLLPLFLTLFTFIGHSSFMILPKANNDKIKHKFKRKNTNSRNRFFHERQMQKFGLTGCKEFQDTLYAIHFEKYKLQFYLLWQCQLCYPLCKSYSAFNKIYLICKRLPVQKALHTTNVARNICK